MDSPQLDTKAQAEVTGDMIQVNHVSKRFGQRVVLDDISFTLATGEVLALIGASGCGKSTLLRIIAGLETPDSGDIIMADPNLTLVFQYSALFDALTVSENVAFTLTEPADFGPPRATKSTPQQLTQQVNEALTFVGLEPEEVSHLYPSALSGGMQKRVSFARAIISQPKIILYDEPTAGLDPLASRVIEEDIVKVRNRYNTTSIVVTHQYSTIMHTATQVMLMDEGCIAWHGNKAEFLTADNPLIKSFHTD
jgi:phospholipid/cholesterol/gamma-HCH transport system ATP-binding protein